MTSEKVDHVLSVGTVRSEQMGGRKIQARSIHGQNCWEGTGQEVVGQHCRAGEVGGDQSWP